MHRGNASFANGARRFANCAAREAPFDRLRLAMADVGVVLTRPRLWAAFAVLSTLFALIGPFDTIERLEPAARLAYWSGVMLLGWVVATVHVALALRLLPELLPEALRAAIGGAATSPCLMHAVALVNESVFGVAFTALPQSALGLAVFAGVGAALTLLNRLIEPANADLLFRPADAAPAAPPRDPAPRPETEAVRPEERLGPPSAPPDPTAAAAPRILHRLPPAKRGALLRLSMQDHYVEIVTDAGSELALLRLSDAIAEASPRRGRQVHRSHWVAEAAVRGARREKGRLHLVLTDGAEVPVSRSRAPELREAGWI